MPSATACPADETEFAGHRFIGYHSRRNSFPISDWLWRASSPTRSSAVSPTLKPSCQPFRRVSAWAPFPRRLRKRWALCGAITAARGNRGHGLACDEPRGMAQAGGEGLRQVLRAAVPVLYRQGRLRFLLPAGLHHLVNGLHAPLGHGRDLGGVHLQRRHQLRDRRLSGVTMIAYLRSARSPFSGSRPCARRRCRAWGDWMKTCGSRPSSTRAIMPDDVAEASASITIGLPRASFTVRMPSGRTFDRAPEDLVEVVEHHHHLRRSPRAWRRGRAGPAW
jgi:hypothetical protein